MSAFGRSMRSTSPRPFLVRAGLSREQLQSLDEPLRAQDIEVVDTLHEVICLAGLPRLERGVRAILMAPASDGLEERDVIRAIRRTDPEIRLVLLLPEDESGRVENALQLGFNDAITLPAAPERLRLAIDPDHPAEASNAPAEEVGPTPPAEASPIAEARVKARRSIVEIVLEEACQRIELEARSRHEDPQDLFDGEVPEGEFSDVRLIRKLLEGDAVTPALLEMIRGRKGCEDVTHERGPLDDGDAMRTTVPVGRPDEGLGFLVSPRPGQEDVLAPLTIWLRHWLLLEDRHAVLRRQAWTDELTGAGNRRSLYRVLGEVIDRARKELRAVTVMFFDIDNFKTYNDRFGHEAGDEVLRETVQLLRSVIRRGDHVFRMGGDEFVVIFAPDPDGPRSACSSPPESIEQIASRFQHQIGSLELHQIGQDAPGRVSISAGMVTYPWDGRTPEKLLRRADELALESKRSGKNVITLAPAARERSTSEFRKDSEESSHEDDPSSGNAPLAEE